VDNFELSLARIQYKKSEEQLNEFVDELMATRQIPQRMTLYEYVVDRVIKKFGNAEYRSREICIKYFGYAILTHSAVEALKKYGPIVEVGAGLGYWAFELQRAGIDIIPTDKNRPEESGYAWGKEHGHKTRKWSDVKLLDATTAALQFRERALMFCWPCYNQSWAAQALSAYQGDTVIYVGEGWSGCTGDDRFHQLLHDNYEDVESIGIQQWYGLHDSCVVYRRKPGPLRQRAPASSYWHNNDSRWNPTCSLKTTTRIPRHAKKVIKKSVRDEFYGDHNIRLRDIRVWQTDAQVEFSLVNQA
jgi:hypothetical protein